MLRMRKARSVFGARRARGFTIIEVMIVLAVTGALFVSAAILIAGRQRQTEFNLAIREVQSQIQRVASEVASGFYPQTGFTCTVSGSGPPVITAATSGQQGTNEDCTFLGKVVQFRVADTDPEEMKVYTLVGRRLSSNNPDAEAGSRQTALPVVVAPTGPGSSVPDNAETINLPSGLTTHSMAWGAGGVDAGAIAFMQSFGEYSGGMLQSGAQHVNVVPIRNTALGMTSEAAAQAINDNIADSPINITSGTRLCFASGTTDQSGLITIGSAGRQLSVTLDIKSNKTCS